MPVAVVFPEVALVEFWCSFMSDPIVSSELGSIVHGHLIITGLLFQNKIALQSNRASQRYQHSKVIPLILSLFNGGYHLWFMVHELGIPRCIILHRECFISVVLEGISVKTMVGFRVLLTAD